MLLSKLDVSVVSVTVGKRGFFGPAAEADGGVYLVFGNKGDGLEGTSDVGIVTKGRIVGEAARAVKILLSWLELHAIF